MWTFFESTVCNRKANPKQLTSVAHSWHVTGVLTDATFASQFEYFRDRYIAK